MKIGIACFNIDWQAGGPRLLLSSARALKALGHTIVIYAPEFAGDAYKELWEGLDFRMISPKKPLSAIFFCDVSALEEISLSGGVT